MKSNFEKIFPDLIRDEGGYSNDAFDAGGATKYGITIGDVRKYIKSDATNEDVKELTLDQAKKIYKERYWNALDCDNLPSGVDYTCFDYGVNSGIGRPKAALAMFKDKSGANLINAINDERVSFLRGLAERKPTQQKFLRGWLHRVERVRSTSLDLAKDRITGPASAVVAGTAATAVVATQHPFFWQFHPYWTLAGAAAVAVVIGIIIHHVRNSGNQNA